MMLNPTPDERLRDARALLTARGELNLQGQWRRPTRNAAAAGQRLSELRHTMSEERRARLAGLETQAAPRSATTPSVNWQYDPQGRLRPVCWEAGQVVVRRAR